MTDAHDSSAALAPSGGNELSTERLRFRRLRSADAAAIASYRSVPDVARYQGWTTPYSPADALALIADVQNSTPDAPGWFQYGIELIENRSLIGDLGVNLDENRRQAEIGFTLDPAYQGRGLASEAVAAMLEHLFVERGLHKVSADCDARNVRSAQLLLRAGFAQEGHRRQHTWSKGEWTDDLLFGLLAANWRRR